MPTNLKNLLSRSRSRNELKLRAPGEELDVPCCESPGSNSIGESNQESGNGTGVDGTGECMCHYSTSPGILRREASCKSLFSTVVSGGGEDADTRVPPMPTTLKSNCCEMRKCETVLALSSFAAASPGNSSSSSSSSTATPTSTTTNRVRVMKDKILSTSSSTLNNLIHSSSRTTSKLFSAWKLSSSSNTTSSSNLNGQKEKLKVPVVAKTRSQLSILENGDGGSDLLSVPGPLTPMNRLRRNVSFTNAQSCCLLGSKFSSINSLNCKENSTEEILCRLCLSLVKTEDTIDFQACSCRYCKDCVEAYVNFEIQEGAYDIACPDASCEKQGVLTSAEIERLVSTQVMGKHKKFRLYREVEKDAELMWCPSPGCETVCQIHEGEEKTNGKSGLSDESGSPKRRTLSIKCSTCQQSFCAECKLSFHPDTSCESHRRKLTKEGKLSIVEDEDLCAIESIKKCPFCHVPIEKDSGCAQMMCKRCNHVFCWYCLASLDDDFLLRHYDKGPCKNKLGHSRASVVWHRAQVIGIFAGFGVLVLLASPLLILVAPCLLCCRCGYCANRLPDEFPVSV